MTIETILDVPTVVTHKTIIPVSMPDGSIYLVKTLLSAGESIVKLAKSNNSGRGIYSVGLTLAPASESGYNVCQFATDGCMKGCLKHSGHNPIASVRRAQIAKTRAFFQHKALFLAKLTAEIERAAAYAEKRGLALAVRLNVLSDIPWERVFPALFEHFPNCQFYDYTKRPGRITPNNYHLTFSRSETNDAVALQEYARGLNVAVVFETADLPASWQGIPVFSGDDDDLRFLDPRGIVGLYAKGSPAKRDTTGFVVPTRSRAVA